MKKLLLSMFVLVTLAPAAQTTAAPATWAVDAAAAPALSGVIEPYLRVQLKLAADTIDGLKADATAMAAAAAKLGKDGTDIAAVSKQLHDATTIDAARDAFLAATTALFAYADSTKTDLGPDVRRTYCPMENKAWAQKNGEILNPYAGKKMLHCGLFTDKK